VIMGVQGSGKGIQGKVLARDLDPVHMSVGDIFRWNVQQHTKLGAQVRRTMAAGELVTDDTVEDIVKCPAGRARLGLRLQITQPRQALDLTDGECWQLLAGVSLGRVVFTMAPLPAIRPVNHLTDGHTIIIRSPAARSSPSAASSASRPAAATIWCTREGDSPTVAARVQTEFPSARAETRAPSVPVRPAAAAMRHGRPASGLAAPAGPPRSAR
jgi:hypothetical protein